MRVFVTGARGQLGHDVLQEALRRGWTAVGADVEDFDVTDRAALRTALAAASPDIVIHCAAYTAVDKAESEPAQAFAVNEDGTRHAAEYCAEKGIWLLYISTDYVFDGSGTQPREVHDPTCPLSVYGKSKWAGEQAVQQLCRRWMIIRTSWVFGSHGGNFVKTMLRLGAQRSELQVVCDQVGAPTYTVHLARLLCDMAQRPVCGIYHAAGAGTCSWAEFAARIMALAGLACRIIEIPSAQYPQAAQRPKNSRLSMQCLVQAGYEPLPPWETALQEMLRHERETGA